MALFRSKIDGAAAVGTERGDVDQALAGAARVVAAEYAHPFLAHATMEPMNATAHVTAERVEIWAPTQGQGPLAGALAQIYKLPPAAIVIHTTFLGGGFGRRFELDFALQAAAVSKAVGRPVQLIWTRKRTCNTTSTSGRPEPDPGRDRPATVGSSPGSTAACRLRS